MDPDESASEATYFKTRSKKINKKWEADFITLGSFFILTLNSVNYYYACHSNNLVRLPQDQTVTS